MNPGRLKLIALLAIIAALPALASDLPARKALPAKGALSGGSAWYAEGESISAPDNSGKKIALAMPVPGLAHPVMRPAVAPKKHAPGYTPVNLTKNSVTLKLPASVDEAADFCSVTARKVGKVGTQKALEVCRWFGTLLKQINQAPFMSPVGAPNTQAQHKLKLWYMPDGRLKTIVER